METLWRLHKINISEISIRNKKIIQKWILLHQHGKNTIWIESIDSLIWKLESANTSVACTQPSLLEKANQHCHKLKSHIKPFKSTLLKDFQGGKLQQQSTAIYHPQCTAFKKREHSSCALAQKLENEVIGVSFEHNWKTESPNHIQGKGKEQSQVQPSYIFFLCWSSTEGHWTRSREDKGGGTNKNQKKDILLTNT